MQSRAMKLRGASTVQWDAFDEPDEAAEKKVAPVIYHAPPQAKTPPPPPRRRFTDIQRSRELCFWSERNPRRAAESEQQYEARFAQHLERRELELGQLDAKRERAVQEEADGRRPLSHFSSASGEQKNQPINSARFQAVFAGERAISSDQLFSEAEKRPFGKSVQEAIDKVSGWFE